MNPPAAPSSSKAPFSWLSAGQVALSLLGTLFFWSQALGALTLGFLPSLGNLVPGMRRGSLFALSLSGALVGAAFLLSAVYAVRRLTGRGGTLPWHRARLRLHGAMYWLGPPAFVLSLFAGMAVKGHAPWEWLFFPPAHVTAVIVPVWWWLALGSRSLRLEQSPQRRWGLVSAGLGLGPFASLLAEIGLLVTGGVLAMFFLLGHPQLAARLETLGRRLTFSAGDPRVAERVLHSAFSEYPWLVFGLMASLGVVVPLLEEFFKPLGVWALMGSRLSPAEGFLAGMLSGGMFSVLEGLFSTAAGEQWGFTVLGRVGTSLMHIAASGLVGWALAAAWENRRYLHLAGAYLMAVALHGVWNVSVTVVALRLGGMLDVPLWTLWLGGAGAGLVALACLFILVNLGRDGGVEEKGNEAHGLVDNPD